MTLRQIELVQQSFRLIQPIIDDAAICSTTGSSRLIRPCSPCFAGRGASRRACWRRRSPSSSKGSIVLRNFGAPWRRWERHAGYGVRDEHYEAVGEALLWTLETGLKDAFTSEVRDAWVTAYGWLAYTMQRGAASHADASQQTGAASAA